MKAVRLHGYHQQPVVEEVPGHHAPGLACGAGEGDQHDRLARVEAEQVWQRGGHVTGIGDAHLEGAGGRERLRVHAGTFAAPGGCRDARSTSVDGLSGCGQRTVDRDGPVPASPP